MFELDVRSQKAYIRTIDESDEGFNHYGSIEGK